MEWFRLYDEIIDDPKVQLLTKSLRYDYIAACCVANRQEARGTLPEIRVIACHWKTTPAKTRRILDRLIASGLIDEDKATKELTVHGWERRQRRSDDVNERVRALRQRDKKQPCNVTVTAPRVRASETETETETEGGGDPPPKPARESTPEERKLIERAAERWGASNGDAVISDLLREYPVDWVRSACDRAWDKHQSRLVVPYLRGVLRGYQRDGGPPKAPDYAPAPDPPAPPLEYSRAQPGWDKPPPGYIPNEAMQKILSMKFASRA